MTGDDLIRCVDALNALGSAAWKHAGDDPYSMAMDATARHQSEADYNAIRALPAIEPAPAWQPIETAPKEKDILVWYDNEADSYYCPENPSKLTDYAAWADGGPFMDGSGICIAKWHESFWESVDEYGGGYWLPAYWFAHQGDDYECVVNPTHWMPLPAPPVAP